MPEGRRVFPGLTVRENIILGGSNRERPARAELEADAEKMFDIFPEIKPFESALGCYPEVVDLDDDEYTGDKRAETEDSEG